MLKKVKAYYEREYKKLLIIPFLLLILALGQIGWQASQPGQDFVNKGISLKGGSTVSFDYVPSFDLESLEQILNQKFSINEITFRTLGVAGSIETIAIDSDIQEKSQIDLFRKEIASQLKIAENTLSVETMGSSLGDSFFKQTLTALLIAFLLMGIVVFFYFKSIAPSLAVILAAASDIVVTLAIFNLTGIKLSTAGIAAFLMLIGYSVDTDILLSTRVLKRVGDGPVMERIYGAMKTGLTMSATTLTAILVAMIFAQSEVIKQIMIILFIGLLVDLVMTWLQNTGILRLYLERKGKKSK
ncbi:protein translocase subunit SecF [Candidatus Woesearchaeota archaeon]|jgi:preprotein translocase subunit SecF|nr:protein translocase subunit SecF [Candidatus Woesearchaeota archaeon]MBT4151244.1 protein translocase subunit SecF [Candidatus Woesearchaeota archaeon]MBT4247283.1 protein translocase subunit SecF [Candidatus Woesearchaeota archaeon]MBT4433996.1 protein translocase subunit SecF [Candidatus Woesearchaeota archaeon]MBT5215675.1 protein translocase subunit SecF [Candidatus Woesearchaeota archaeon]